MNNIKLINEEYHKYQFNVEKKIEEIIRERVRKYDSSIIIRPTYQINRICVEYDNYNFSFAYHFDSDLYLRGSMTIRNSKLLPKDIEKEKKKAYNYVKSIIRQCLEEDI